MDSEFIRILRQDNHSYEELKYLYAELPKYTYQYLGTSVQPNGRAYVGITLELGAEGDNMPFSAVAQLAADKMAGLAILENMSQPYPNITLHYGSVWSFLEYGDLRGASNSYYAYEEAVKINSSDPFAVKIASSNEYTIGEPSEDFFPSYIRQQIAQEVLAIHPQAKLDFKIYSLEDFAVSKRIMLSLGIQLEPDGKDRLYRQLTWFMPPYLPIYLP